MRVKSITKCEWGDFSFYGGWNMCIYLPFLSKFQQSSSKALMKVCLKDVRERQRDREREQEGVAILDK